MVSFGREGFGAPLQTHDDFGDERRVKERKRADANAIHACNDSVSAGEQQSAKTEMKPRSLLLT